MRGTAATVAVNIGSLVLGLITGIVSARALDPADRGLFVAIVVWAGALSAISLLGGQQAVIFHAGGSWRGGITHAVALGRSSTREVAVLSCALGAIVLWLSWEHPGRWLLVVIAAMVIPLSAIVQLVLSALIAGRRLMAWNLIRIAPPVWYALLSVLLLSVGRFSVASGLLALLAGNVAALVAALLAVRVHGLPSGDSAVDVRPVKAYGRRSLLASLPGMLRSRADQMVLTAVAEPSVLGIYAVAASVAAIADIASLTANQLVFPRFVSDPGLRKHVRALALGGVAAATLAVLPIAVLGERLIRWFYGAPYASAAQPLYFLLMAAAIKVGIAFLSAEAQALDRLRILGVSQTVSLIGTAALVVVLVPCLEMNGAALAALLGQAACFIMLWIGLRQVKRL